MTAPILMLDLDGVLNCRRWFAENKAARTGDRDHDMIDPAAVELLNEIIDRTGCRVVVSSSWRLSRTLVQLQRVLKARGFRHTLLGRTPYQVPPVGKVVLEIERGHEIQRWLEDNGETDARVCILDDSSDMADLMPFLVRTSWGEGLQREHVERAVAMLNGEAESRESRRLEVVGG